MEYSTTVRDVVVAWAEANLLVPQARLDFVRNSTEALQKDEDCFFTIGPDITRGRKPYLVSLFAKNFFAFTLTKQQAGNLGALTKRMTRTTRPSSPGMTLRTPMPIEINRFEIDKSNGLSSNAPITGRVHYEVSHLLSVTPVASLEYDLKEHASVTGYYHPNLRLSSSGVMEFSFPPVADANLAVAASWRTTTAAFFRFVTIPDPSNPDGTIPISNALGVLLDVHSNS